MTLPQNLDGAAAFWLTLTPGDWHNAAVGAIVVLVFGAILCTIGAAVRR